MRLVLIPESSPADDQEKHDQQAEHHNERQPFLRRAWRHCREDEMLFLRNCSVGFWHGCWENCSSVP